MALDDAARFWRKVNIGAADECWAWRAGIFQQNGYGQFRWNGEPTTAHRVAYMLMIGEIPDGHHLHHLCRNRVCVNPGHLVPVPANDHLAAHSRERRTTHCPRGHERVQMTTGKWYCRECVKLAARERRATGRR